jgi:hypothetical protein
MSSHLHMHRSLFQKLGQSRRKKGLVGANLEGLVDHCLHLAARLALSKAFSLHEDPNCVGRLCGSFALLFDIRV